MMAFVLSDAQCQWITDNTGKSRFTLKHMHKGLNEAFGLSLAYDEFIEARAEAIAAKRCKNSYFRNYFKGENSKDRNLKAQAKIRHARLTGGCRFKADSGACGNKTEGGRYCSKHLRAGFPSDMSSPRSAHMCSTLGKYF